jgi:hypothetical protein
MGVPRSSLVSLFALALSLGGCGDASDPSQPSPASAPEIAWRAASAEAGGYAAELRVRGRWFVRFRVEGANDGEHT